MQFVGFKQVLRNVNLPSTVTNTRSNVANRLVDDLIKKKPKKEKFLDYFFFFPELVTDTRVMLCDTGMDRLRLNK